MQTIEYQGCTGISIEMYSIIRDDHCSTRYGEEDLIIVLDNVQSVGLMLVGPTGSGKTKSYESLQIAMTHMKGKINPAGSPFKPAHTYVLNPKSITMGQLYGAFDDLTHEW